MRLSTEFWAKVAPVASVLAGSQEDDALREAWQDRMRSDGNVSTHGRAAR